MSSLWVLLIEEADRLVRDFGSKGTLRMDDGFTLIELLFVVLIIGILLTIVMPSLLSARNTARKMACFANQRTIEEMVSVWQANTENTDTVLLAGPVNAAHPLISGHYILRPPRCPSAPAPVDRDNPAVAEGIFTLNASGTVLPCTFGDFGEHGHF